MKKHNKNKQYGSIRSIDRQGLRICRTLDRNAQIRDAGARVGTGAGLNIGYSFLNKSTKMSILYEFLWNYSELSKITNNVYCIK